MTDLERKAANVKRITLAIAALSTIADAAAAVTGLLSPEWAALVAAMGAGSYALVRTLQKVRAGASWKEMAMTTEAWGVGLAIVVPILTATAGLMRPEHAAGVVVVAGVLLKVSRSIQAAKLTPTPKDG
jgi:hypothetical protein